MRILILTPTIGESYGTEQVIKSLGEGLRSRQVEVHYLASRQSGAPPQFDSGELLPTLFSINSLTKRRIVSETREKLLACVNRISPDIIHLMEQLDHRLLYPLLKKSRVCLTSHTVATTSPSSCRMIKNDKVCEKRSGWACLLHNKYFHCLDYLKDDVRRLHAIFEYLRRKKSHQKAHAILGPSQYICDLLKAEGWNKIHYVPNPVPRIETDMIEHPSPLISTACRLVPMKGIDRLIHALKIVESIPWTLWICGDGPEKNNLMSLVSKLNLDKRISFQGLTAPSKTHQIVRSSQIYLQSNLGPESFGLSAAEAGELGVPVVGFNVPGLNETVLNEKTGYLVEMGNILALSQAIKSLLSDNDLAKRMGQRAQEHIRSRFSLVAHIDATMRVYEHVMAIH